MTENTMIDEKLNGIIRISRGIGTYHIPNDIYIKYIKQLMLDEVLSLIGEDESIVTNAYLLSTGGLSNIDQKIKTKNELRERLRKKARERFESE